MELTNKLSKTLLGAGLALALGFALAAGNPAAAQETCVAPPSDLIGWWDADAVSGTIATDIKGGNDGTMLGGVTIASGMVGNAFSFNGTDFQHIQLPFDSGDVFTNQFTVDAWAFPTKLYTFANGGNILVNDDQATTANRGMFLALVGGINIPFLIQGIFHNTSGVQFNVEADTTTGAWHHYAVTYDSSNLCLYQDGNQEVCVAASGNVNDNNRKFQIAGVPNIPDPARFYGGLIDEVEIFDRALTATKIAAIYNAGTAGKCKTMMEADLSITKTDDPDPVVAGQTLTYTVTVTNNGPDDAENVVVTDTLPPSVTSVGTSSDCAEGANGVPTCSLGTIADGASKSYTIAVTVDAATAAGTITNEATVTSDADDPDSGNDEATEDTVVIQLVDIDIKPGSFPNSVNSCSKGVIPVAILGSASLDVRDINPDSLTFADAGVKTVGKSGKLLCSIDDVSGDFTFPEGDMDGFDDLVCQFLTVQLASTTDNTMADVNGVFSSGPSDGFAFVGTDSINYVDEDCLL